MLGEHCNEEHRILLEASKNVSLGVNTKREVSVRGYFLTRMQCNRSVYRYLMNPSKLVEFKYLGTEPINQTS
jgi:hypothetical protein